MGHLFQLDSLRKAMLQIRFADPLDGHTWVARVKPTVHWRLHLIDLSEGTIPIFVSLEHDSFLAHNLQLRKFLILDEGDDSVISLSQRKLGITEQAKKIFINHYQCIMLVFHFKLCSNLSESAVHVLSSTPKAAKLEKPF